MLKKKNMNIEDLFESINNSPKIQLFQNNNIMLHHKTKRTIYLSDSSTFGNRCTICLEYEKYTQDKCMKCIKCNSYFHKKCYIYNFPKSNLRKRNKFICYKCRKTNEKCICILCGDDKGIMKNIEKNIYTHIYCLRFFVELKDKILENFRQWRFNSKCKVCKKVIDNIPVIKCKNTKCKNFYHIKCAIERNAIFSLSYQEIFFKIKKKDLIPFYCNFHSIYLVKAYQLYISKVDSGLIEEKIPNIKYQKVNNSIVIIKDLNTDLNNIKKKETNINYNENKVRNVNRKLCIFLEKRKTENGKKILIENEKYNNLINNNESENEEKKIKKDFLQINETPYYNDNYFKYDSTIFNKTKKSTIQELKEGLKISNNDNLIYKINDDHSFLSQKNEEEKEKEKNKNEIESESEINSSNTNNKNKKCKNDYNWHINLGMNNFSSPESTSGENIDIFQLFNQINKDRSLPVYFYNRQNI
jgi:hypothetical protein